MWFGPLLLVKTIHCDFSLEILNSVRVAHLEILYIVSCSSFCTVLRLWLLHQKLKSSAKRLAFTGLCIVVVMSLIVSKKRVTDSEDPWGIPLVWM